MDTPYSLESHNLNVVFDISQNIKKCRQYDEEISGICIKNAEIENEDLSYLSFKTVVFDNCKLLSCDFNKTSFSDVVFKNCNMSNSVFSEAFFGKVTIKSSKLIGSSVF